MRLLIKISLLILKILFVLSHRGKTPKLVPINKKSEGGEKRWAYQVLLLFYHLMWAKKHEQKDETLLSDNTLIKPDTSNNVAAATRSILFQHVLALFAEVRKLFTAHTLLQFCSGVVSTLLKCTRFSKCSLNICTHLVLYHWCPLKHVHTSMHFTKPSVKFASIIQVNWL